MAKNTKTPARRYVNELASGEFIEDQVFLIAQKDLRTTNNGSLYIHCVLADKGGQILGRIWQASEAMYQQMPEGGFLRFKGRVESYKGSLQFIIDGVRPVDPDSVELAEFVPATSEDVDEMFDRVKEILRQIKHPDLLLLIKQFVTDDAMMAQFRKSPAAIMMHHAYVGGLLEHTRNLMELALLIMPRYPKLSQDLVLAGVFLHDIGKTAELRCETSFEYTTEGQLVGHIVQATVWIEEKAKAVEAETGKPFPADVKTTLQHMILSHHGTHEFGSPKLPAMPEAIVLHHLDNIDAKINMYMGKIEDDADPNSDWTEYLRGAGTKVYKKDVFGVRGNQ